MEDHARERFGRSGRWLRDQGVLGETIARLPEIERALDGSDGGAPIGKVAAVVMGRAATAETVRAWIALARRVAVRELKQTVAAGLGASSDRLAAAAHVPPDGKRGGAASPGNDDDRAGSECAGAGHPEPGVERRHLRRATLPAGERRHATPSDEQADDDLLRITMPVPAAVRAAFDETLVLYRAVSGCEASVSSFVEALVAESLAGPQPPEAGAGSPGSARCPDVAVETISESKTGAALVERALARSSGSWAALPHGAERTGAVAASHLLSRLQTVSRRAGEGDAAELDRQIRTLVALEDELERELGRMLCAIGERGGWVRLMFAGLRHYAEQRLGLRRTAAEGRARLARALRRLPHLRQAYEEGRVGFESAILVLRILGRDPVEDDVERAWVERAAEATVKRLRDEARALGRHRAVAASRGCPGAPAGMAPRPMSDADWHGSLHQRPGEIRERVHDLGNRSAAAVGGAFVDSSDVFLRLRLPEGAGRELLAAIESRRRGLTAEVEAVPWDEPWPEAAVPASLRAARTFSGRCRRVPAWVGLLALLEDFVDTWDDAGGMPQRRAQSVYVRDGWRCAAPGCTSRRNLEDHHVQYRSRGGERRGLSNRICLCRFHHARGEHGGLASCRGAAPLDLLWRLGRADVGEWFRNERRSAGRLATVA